MTFQVVATADIQAESLRLFMQALGYYPARVNGGFFTMNPSLAANRVVSTATAIKLHNLTRNDWKRYKDTPYYRAENLPLEILVSEYTLDVLMVTKLCEQVKFQASRNHLNGLVFPPDANANLIKTRESLRSLFGITE